MHVFKHPRAVVIKAQLLYLYARATFHLHDRARRRFPMRHTSGRGSNSCGSTPVGVTFVSCTSADTNTWLRSNTTVNKTVLVVNILY
ncbi:hypothetical protein MBAV_005006 [Candidatus Magnetobacterium bavaricum]|uniref:Uncharacterized protein n=1 Tax=Candidatus Magnetobacterium bavaricum TaxID=29290 RepID=A0A0F3GLQ5_9BACT|nr:hypothetical protein MBAV_005006 [Candidatus Magnetobacterium bavaricum]